MAKKVINSFNGGQLSPYLDGRSDIQKYNSGCVKCENFLPLVYGGVIRRPAFKKLFTSENNSRVIPFYVNRENQYLLSFEQALIKVFDLDGLEIDFMTTAYNESELNDIQFTQNNDVLFLVHPNHPPIQIVRKDNDFTLEVINFDSPPFLDTNTIGNHTLHVSEDSNNNVFLHSNINLFETSHILSYWRLDFFRSNLTQEINYNQSSTGFTANRGFSPSINVSFSNWTVECTQKAYDTFIQKSTDGGETFNDFLPLGIYAHAHSSPPALVSTQSSAAREKGNTFIRVRYDRGAGGTGDISINITPDEPIIPGIVQIKEIINARKALVNVISPVEYLSNDYLDWTAGTTYGVGADVKIEQEIRVNASITNAINSIDQANTALTANPAHFDSCEGFDNSGNKCLYFVNGNSYPHRVVYNYTAGTSTLTSFGSGAFTFDNDVAKNTWNQFKKTGITELGNNKYAVLAQENLSDGEYKDIAIFEITVTGASTFNVIRKFYGSKNENSSEWIGLSGFIHQVYHLGGMTKNVNENELHFGTISQAYNGKFISNIFSLKLNENWENATSVSFITPQLIPGINTLQTFEDKITGLTEDLNECKKNFPLISFHYNTVSINNEISNGIIASGVWNEVNSSGNSSGIYVLNDNTFKSFNADSDNLPFIQKQNKTNAIAVCNDSSPSSDYRQTYLHITDGEATGDLEQSYISELTRYYEALEGHTASSNFQTDFEAGKWLEVDTTTSFWAEGAYSFKRGFPNSISFFDERLIYGGNLGSPNRIYISKLDDYYYFYEDTNDNDAFRLDLISNEPEEITWFAVRNNLTIGTNNSEWTLDNGSSLITPNEVSLRRRSKYGSNKKAAIVLGDTIAFLMRQGRKLREWVLRDDQLTVETKDLTVLSENITEGGIENFVYQNQPDNIVYASKTDGSFVGLTYQKEQNVFAWHQHKLGNAKDYLYTQPASSSFSTTVTGFTNAGNMRELFYVNIEFQLDQPGGVITNKGHNAPLDFDFYVAEDINSTTNYKLKVRFQNTSTVKDEDLADIKLGELYNLSFEFDQVINIFLDNVNVFQKTLSDFADSSYLNYTVTDATKHFGKKIDFLESSVNTGGTPINSTGKVGNFNLSRGAVIVAEDQTNDPEYTVDFISTSGNVITATTTQAHGLSASDNITLEGFYQNNLGFPNGARTVTSVVDTNTITIDCGASVANVDSFFASTDLKANNFTDSGSNQEWDNTSVDVYNRDTVSISGTNASVFINTDFPIKIKSLAVMPSVGSDDTLYATTQIRKDNDYVYWTGQMDSREISNYSQYNGSDLYQEGYVYADAVTGAVTLSGLTDYAGMVVRLTVDGLDKGDITISSTGTSTITSLVDSKSGYLPYHWSVGFPFTSTVAPMYVKADDVRTGSNKALLHFKDTVSAKAGQTESTVEDVLFDPSSTTEKSGIAEVYFSNADDYLNTCFILQSKSEPCTLLSMVTYVE